MDRLTHDNGPRSSSECEDCASALVAAACDNDLPLMSQLPHGSLDIKFSTFYFATALHWATYGCQIEPTSLLLENGADTMARDWWNRTSLPSPPRKATASF